MSIVQCQCQCHVTCCSLYRLRVGCITIVGEANPGVGSGYCCNVSVRHFWYISAYCETVVLLVVVLMIVSSDLSVSLVSVVKVAIADAGGS